MARDLFQDFGLNPQAEKEGRDLFKEYGIDPAGAAIGGNEDSARIAVPAVLGNKSRVNSNFADDVGTDFKRGILGLPGAVTGLVDAGYNLTPVPKLVNMAGDPLGLGGRPTDAVASKLGELTGIQPAKWAKESEAEYSPSRQQASRGINEAWDQARLSDPGTWADVAKAYMENPEATLGTIVESAPSMVAGGVLGKGLKAANLLRSGSAAAGAGEGAIMAGQAMDSIDRKVDPQTAAKASLAIGVGGGLLGAYGSKIANKIGIRDFETAIVGGVPLEKSLPLYARIPAGILQEGVFEELPQSVQEQVFKNLAEGKPWHDGVARSAVEGALAGGLMGGAFNVPGSRTELSAGSAQIEPTGATPQSTGTTAVPTVASGSVSNAVVPDAAQPAVAPIDQAALLSQLAALEVTAQQQGGLTPEQAEQAKAMLAKIEETEAEDGPQTGSAVAPVVAQWNQEAGVDLLGSADDLGSIHDGSARETGANTGLPVNQVQRIDPVAPASAPRIEQPVTEPIVQTLRTKEIDAKLSQIAADIPNRTAPVQASLQREAERLRQDRAEEVQKVRKISSNRIELTDSLLVAIAKLGGMDTAELLNNGFDRSDISTQKGARVSKKTGDLGKAPWRPISLGFNQPLHRNGGMSFDGMREMLVQHGYLPENASKNDAIDLFRRELSGDSVYTAEGGVDRKIADNEARDEYFAAQAQAEQEELLRENAAKEEVVRKAYDELLNAAVLVDIDAQEIIDSLGLSETASIQDVLEKATPVIDEIINARIDDINAKLADAIEEGDIDVREFQQAAAREAEGSNRNGVETVGSGRSKRQGAAQTTGRDNKTGQGSKDGSKGDRAEGLAFILTGQTEAEIKADEARHKVAEEAARQEEIKRAAEEQQARDLAEIKRRNDAANQEFTLGQSAEDNLSGQKSIFDQPLAPESQKKTAPASEMDALKAEMGQAIGELVSILGGKINMTPEEESKIIPIMSKIFRVAAKMGYIKFRDAARYVMDQIRVMAGDAIADKISIENLQAGYVNIAKEIGGDKRDAMSYDSIKELENDNGLNQRSSTDLERNSKDADPQNGMGEKGVRSGRDGDGGTGRPGIQGNEGQGGAARSSSERSGNEAAPAGERSDSAIYTGEPELSRGSAGNRVDIGSRNSGVGRTPVEPIATKATEKSATSALSLKQKQEQQKQADKQPHSPWLDGIRHDLPILTASQQEDVAKAEARFDVPDGYGMLFTNGTGTGKTFTGLGVIKRMTNQGKNNILVVAPNDKIIEDWQKAGKLLGLELSRLADTNDAGQGIVITTYANMGQNNELAKRGWDLVVHDEAHYLAMDKDGTETTFLTALRAISMHPDGVIDRANMIHSDLVSRLATLDAAAKSQRMSDDERHWHEATDTQRQADALRKELEEKRKAIKEDVLARQNEQRTRVLFLSATPFAYEKTIDWANGYLFDYNEGRGNEEREFRGYNTGSNRELFFMQHLGYRMRYNKLTAPDAKVDSGLMQRQFNTWLKKRGSLSGRMLDVTADYDRRFILVDSAIGARIDDALQWFETKRKAQHNGTGEIGERIGAIMAKADPYTTALAAVRDHIAEKFDYLSRRYLLESIKAREVIPHIREHLAMGRKVVVFHDYKKGGGFNPFILGERTISEQGSKDAAVSAAEWNRVVREFNAEFNDIINSDLFKQSSPIQIFQQEFPGVLLFNGDVPTMQRRNNVARFNDDGSGPQVILVQSAAGKEGISLHDTTGKHQRVLFNLGQPTQPTTAIQQEGRIYRVGQVTDAIFRYLNTGTNWEKWAFATTIAQRASTAENLGMGELARALKDAFITAFEESGNYRAGMDDEGKGGKERDRAANNALTEYDRARAFYFSTLKKDSRTKAQEGTDYFATPEPIGLKMVELADIRPGESVLEPSAGHGAIARWIPETTERTAIEPSMTLRPRLAMVFDGKIEGTDFESLHIVNKYDAIVMNPPFGSGGKMAMDHLVKAAMHLRDGGRIVALIPRGPMADKLFEKWMHESEERKLKPVAEHPTLGPVFKGDTILSRTSFAKESTFSHLDKDGGWMVSVPGRIGSTMITTQSIAEIQPTGKRTESYRPSKGFHLVADINLPQVTFERAGTGVATRIVVIEKSPDLAQQISRDYSDVTDINELFDRIEHLSVRERAKAKEENSEEAPAKGKKTDRTKKATATAHSETGKVQEAGGEATVETAQNGKLLTDAPRVEYVTKKGKKIYGVIAKSLTKDQAKAIDEYTWAKDGGYFIRMEHVTRPDSDIRLSRSEQDARQGLQWKGISSNETGTPIYTGDGFVLDATREINTETDFEEDGLPLGHASLVEGTTYRFAIADNNNNQIGFMDAEVNDFGEIDTIHDIELTNKNTGLGTKIIETILANAYDGVRILDVVPEAKRFWGKFGADYYGSSDDFIKNARIEWSAYQRQSVRQSRLSRESASGVRGILEGQTDRAGREETSGQQEVTTAQLQSLSNRIAAQLPHMPAVHVFDSPLAKNVPAALRDYIEQQDATYDVEGAMFNGELYMFAKNLASIERAEHVLATHEITHVGLRGAIGEELDTALRHIWVNNSKVRKAAHELKQRLGIRSNEVAVEEVLADMPTSELIQLKGWRKAVLAVRNWLNRIGAETLAKKMDDLLAGNLSEQEQADLFVADLVTSAREWVKSGKPGPWAVAVKERLSATANNLSLSEWEASIINSGNYARLSLANELLYGIPNLPQGNRAIDGAELRALRRAAAGLEKPEKGLFLFVTEDGKALVTGYQGKRIPPIFIGFARQNNLKLEAYRAIPGRTTAMPVQSREEGATYFEERDAQRKPIERTGLTRFSARPVEAKKRAVGFDDKNSFIVADFKNDEPLKAHPDYKAAKAGDVAAAGRLVQALVKPASIEDAKKAFGPDAIYVPAHAEEASGKNNIPNMLAALYAKNADGEIGAGIFQTNRAFHTGANAMERLLARAEFVGKVEPGRRYVLVDDVTTMGSTLADLANHIRSQGGEVVGSIVLVNAARSGMLKADRKTIRELEARHGEEISKLFSIEPGALTWSESQYLLGFRTTDELRNRVAKARSERSARLRAKGVLSRGEDSQGSVGEAGLSGTATRHPLPASIEEPKDRAGNLPQQSDDIKKFGIRLSRAGNQPFAQQPAPQNRWQSLKQKLSDLVSAETFDSFIYNYQDKLIDLKRKLQDIKEKGGTVTDLNDAYLGEEMYHSRVATRTESFINAELDPLIRELHANKISLPEFERFLHARHAPEANAEMAKRNPNQQEIDAGRASAAAAVKALQLQVQSANSNGTATKALEAALMQAKEELKNWNSAKAYQGTEDERQSLSGMSNAEAQAVFDSLSPERKLTLETLAEKVDSINATTLDTLEAYGLIGKPEIDAWRKLYKHYVPLHRDEAHPDTASHPVGQGFSVKGRGIKTRTGSTEKVTHILGHIAIQREQALTRGEKNLVSKRLYLLVTQNPDKEFWSIDNKPMVSMINKKTGFVERMIDPRYMDKPNVLILRIAGKDVAIVFNEHNPNAVRLAAALKNLDVADIGAALTLVAKGTRYFSAINTQYNPVFGIVNGIRDLSSGMLNLTTTELKGKQLQVAADARLALRAIYRAERGKTATNQKWADLWNDFQETGGPTGYRDLHSRPEDRSKALIKALGALDRGGAMKVAHAIFDWLSDYNQAIENAVRLSAYKNGLDIGMSKERAASLAKNLTVNFNRKGEKTRIIGSLYAFFNASMQGTARMMETMTGPAGRRVLVGGIALGAINTLLSMAMMGGDDDDNEYDKIPEFIKERNLIIPYSKTGFITIPMPLGFHVLPNVGRLAAEFVTGGNSKTAAKQAGKMLSVIIDSFNPMGGSSDIGQTITPTIADPALALYRNKDWTGRKIYRENINALDPKPGHQMTKDTATEPSKALSKAINWATGGTDYMPGEISWTPDQIDYVMGQLTGGAGREVLKLAQLAASPFTGEEIPAHKIPLIGRFRGSTEGQHGQSERYFENITKVNMVENELKGRAQQGESLNGFYERYPIASLIGQGNEAERKIQLLRAARRRVVSSNDPDAKERAKWFDLEIGQTMKRLNQQASRKERS